MAHETADAGGAAAASGRPSPSPGLAAPPPTRSRRLARNTAIFAIATGLSRIAGLVREIVASSYFGTRGSFSAFTIAFQVPNLVRSLFADQALSAAFVPVFAELLEKGKRREAFRLASTLLGLIVAALGSLTLIFIIFARPIMSIFTGDTFTPELDQLTAGLARVLFPIVLILGVNGLVVGILQTYEHFTIPAISPLVWNAVIIALLVWLKPHFHGDDQMYAYAIGVLIATAVQLGMALPVLRKIGFHFHMAFDWRDPRVAQVFKLMLPVTLGLGIINFDLLLNSSLGSLVSEQAPRAIDAAFRIYMLPQGMFSVAIATVLFPTLSRLAARRDYSALGATMANGIRQIFLLLIPAAAITIALAVPITRLIYQRGAFNHHSTEQVSTALFWFSFSLPFAGANLLLTRTFFSLQRPWIPTSLAAANLAVNAAVSVALYKPLGIAGLVIGTAVASAGMTFAQGWALRRDLGADLQVRRTTIATGKMLFAAAALGGVSYGTWWCLNDALGQGTVAQIISVGFGILAGALVYAGLVLLMRIPEAGQIQRLLLGRLRRRRR